jgi:hypothetical protein
MTIKADKYNWNRVKFCRKITIFKMSTRNFLRVAEFSTRNLDIPTRILLVLYSKFRALIYMYCLFNILRTFSLKVINLVHWYIFNILEE